jgi:hypothetical protein
MNRPLLVFFAICAGALGFSQLRRAAEPIRAAGEAKDQRLELAANDAAKTRESAAALKGEVSNKRNRLRAAGRHPEISPALLQLLETDFARGDAAAWAELRQQLDIGWDSSPDYVLVSKRVLKGLQYKRLLSAERPSDMACDILALSPVEQSGIRSALDQARQAVWQTAVVRSEPGGDIAAQYTVQPPDPVVQESVSNTFAAAVVGAVGPERADLLLPGVPGAWSELESGLWPQETQTMTIRQTVVDGVPDLVWECTRGDSVSTEPVRYGHLPSGWLGALFPGGWQALAQREGFELPPSFQGNP